MATVVIESQTSLFVQALVNGMGGGVHVVLSLKTVATSVHLRSPPQLCSMFRFIPGSELAPIIHSANTTATITCGCPVPTQVPLVSGKETTIRILRSWSLVHSLPKHIWTHYFFLFQPEQDLWSPGGGVSNQGGECHGSGMRGWSHGLG